MSNATQSVTAAQEQILERIRQNQQAVLENVRKWAEAAEGLASGAPTSTAVDYPQPKELVASQFDFAEKLLASQREFVEELVAATVLSATTGKGAQSK